MLMAVDLISFILLIVCVLLGVAFLTLFERSGLGYIQARKGPTKVGYGGILQPFADAIKLLVSEVEQPTASNFFPYFLCPILSLFLSLVVWSVVPYKAGGGAVTFSMLFFLCVVGVGVYTVMGSGWFSNSKYALLGCLRFVAQTISYEVSMAMVIIIVALLLGSYGMFILEESQGGVWNLFLFLPLSMSWVVIMLAETNRTPFDFAEGESELVSGFNVEYGGGGFALLFMAEYASILMMSLFFCVVFLGGAFNYVSFLMITIVFLFIWVRGLLPRLRYDMLMYLAWKDLLPLVLNYFMFFFGLMLIGWV